MTDKKFSNLDKLEIVHAWGVFQNSSIKLIVQEAINNIILNELQTFEYIDADKFASQKAKIEGMRQILGTLNLPEDMILKTLKL